MSSKFRRRDRSDDVERRPSSGPSTGLVLLLGGLGLGAVLLVGIVVAVVLMFRSLGDLADGDPFAVEDDLPGQHAHVDIDALADQHAARQEAAHFIHQLMEGNPEAAYNNHATANFRRQYTVQDLRKWVADRPPWGEKNNDFRVRWDVQAKDRNEFAVTGWMLGAGNVTLDVVRDGGAWKVERYRLH